VYEKERRAVFAGPSSQGRLHYPSPKNNATSFTKDWGGRSSGQDVGD
jgi:hypothetical protein